MGLIGKGTLKGGLRSCKRLPKSCMSFLMGFLGASRSFKVPGKDHIYGKNRPQKWCFYELSEL